MPTSASCTGATKEGLGPAYIAGFRRALASGAGLMLEMDSDFSHDPAYLPRLLDAARRADLVIGSRYVAGGGVSDWGPVRRLISRGGSVYSRLVLGVEVHDLTGGFKCFRREVLEAIDLDSIEVRGYAFQVEMTYRAIQLGFRWSRCRSSSATAAPASRRWTGRSSPRRSSASPAFASARDHVQRAERPREEPTVEEA